MIFREFQPNILLTPYIETYWAAWVYNQADEFHKILPDGCVDVIFSLKDGSGKAEMKAFLPYIVGTMTSFLEVESGETKMVGIRFKPGGITAFTHTPIFEFTNQLVDIQSCETILDKYFYDNIEEKETIEDVILHINQYLLQKLSSLFVSDKHIDYAVSIIKQAKGNIVIPTLAQKVCLGERQFERRFKSAIGVSAKTFSRIVKFNNTLRFIETNPHQSLFETAVDCGYYDHSHLIKEFKSMAGSSPLELII